MKAIDLPPYAPTLIESTRAIGYSLEAAVADIIDNSIAAGASKVDLFFFPIGDAYISILDNGTGMNAEELNCAMQYGSKNPNLKRDERDLGRFGLGLKTASLSQCRCLTVVSKQGESIEGRRWDLDHVAQAESWSLLVLNADEINALPQMDELMKYKSGTLVVWQNLDRLSVGETSFEQTLGKKIDAVREHLSLVYHRYISGEKGIIKLKLRINGSDVQAQDPFLTGKSNQPMDDEVIIIRGEKILIRAYILPHISKLSKAEIDALGGKDGLRAKQGFYVYRNKRLLVAGDWFRMMRKGDLSKLARIQVDIPNTLDDLWTLDIKKSVAIPPVEVRENLKSIIAKLAEHSKRTWTFRGKKEINDKEVRIWNRLKNSQGAFYYEINRNHPMVEHISAQSSETGIMLNELLKQIEIGLPLNQLYVDLCNDEQLTNDYELSKREIVNALKSMFTPQMTVTDKISLLNTMENIEPFSQYVDAVEKLKKEVLENAES